METNNIPLVTIGIPFFNNEMTLDLSIKSVVMQTFTNWELLLINDGSVDKSLEIAKKYCELDSRIHLINDSKNQGLVSRLNQIINSAKGIYIARMDADDVMMKHKLERQIDVFKSDHELDVVATGAYTIDQQDTPVGVRGLNPLQIVDSKKLFAEEFLIHPTILVKKAWYKENRYDKKYVRAEDLELWCRTFNNTKFHRIPEPLFLYREGKVNIKNYLLSMKTVRLIIKKYGPNVLNNYAICIAITKTYLKSWLYLLAGVFNTQDLLSAKRNVKITESQFREVLNVIKEIQKFDQKMHNGIF